MEGDWIPETLLGEHLTNICETSSEQKFIMLSGYDVPQHRQRRTFKTFLSYVQKVYLPMKKLRWKIIFGSCQCVDDN